jgi:hypothetical protein
MMVMMMKTIAVIIVTVVVIMIIIIIISFVSRFAHSYFTISLWTVEQALHKQRNGLIYIVFLDFIEFGTKTAPLNIIQILIVFNMCVCVCVCVYVCVCARSCGFFRRIIFSMIEHTEFSLLFK